MPRGASTLDVGPNNLFLFLWGIRPFQAAVPQVWETLDECLSTFLTLLLFNMVTMGAGETAQQLAAFTALGKSQVHLPGPP